MALTTAQTQLFHLSTAIGDCVANTIREDEVEAVISGVESLHLLHIWDYHAGYAEDDKICYALEAACVRRERELRALKAEEVRKERERRRFA